jgi:hypothetical protein
MKRKSTTQDENRTKVPKLELNVKSEPAEAVKSVKQPKKPTNVANILKEQDLNGKKIKKELTEIFPKNQKLDIVKKKKPKYPAERVLVSLGAELGCGDVLTNYLSKSHRKSAGAVAAFMHFVHARQEIFKQKSSGKFPPYTNNEVMSSKWFTNMYRELDRGTMYFRKQILAEHDLSPESYPDVVFKAIVYRLINKIETFEEFGKLPSRAEWKAFQKFICKKKDQGDVIFTSAHQNMGFSRFCHTAKEVLKMIDNENFTKAIVDAESLEHCFLLLKSITNIGPFFAWQISCDFLELKMINFDENTWTCLGPGAKSGLRRIFTVKSEKEELPLAQHLTKIMDYGFNALGLDFPYFLNRKLTLKNIEHALCEYDKYFRAATKQPTRERLFNSRSSLDTNSCLECSKRFSVQSSSCMCVLCGLSFHQECLGTEKDKSLVDGQWWLCSKCHNLEMGDRDDDDDKTFIYEEVKDKFKIRPVRVFVKPVQLSTLCTLLMK